MANPEHEAIAKRGSAAIYQWRKRNIGQTLDLAGADLRKIDLRGAKMAGANLSEAKLHRAQLLGTDLTRANLVGARLLKANLSGTKLLGANLQNARLKRARLIEADLESADLSDADLTMSHLLHVNLRVAKLTRANLYTAEIIRSNLGHADLSEAKLRRASIYQSNLNETQFNGATFGWTRLCDVGLARAKGLETVKHRGPSSVALDTLKESNGRVPLEFLKGCGCAPWEVDMALLYDPGLSNSQVADILTTSVFEARTDGPFFLGGTFISYSHSDTSFVNKLYCQLKSRNIPVWLDQHDLLAGDVEKQLIDNIRLQDVVVLVLSESSLKSDWVWMEIETALKKEKEESRDVICPIALDDTWKSYERDRVLMRRVKTKNILDFSAWKTKKFKNVFDKLVRGLRSNYRPNN